MTREQNYIIKKVKIFLCFVLALASVTSMIIPLSGFANATSNESNNYNINNDNSISSNLTQNEIAAGGPIPPNYTLAFNEEKCVQGEDNPPWSPTLLSYEHHDVNRTHLYQCATFTGSLTEPNQVYAYKSPDIYYTPSMMVTGGINEMYVYGGASYNAVPIPSGSFVSKIEPGTLKELWRTNLLNTNISGIWTGAGSIESIGGDIFAITNTYLYKLNATTGKVEGVLSLPTGASAPRDSYFNGMSGWSDGTLVMKNLARGPGCDVQGFFALFKCSNVNATPPSAMVAVDSKTFEVLDWVQLEEMIGGRITATEYNGKDYAYLTGKTNLYRYEWDGKNLTEDKSWGPVSLLLPGQSAASACGIAKEWVICMTNGGAPTETPLSIVAISQANASNVNRIEPIPLSPGQISYIPSMPAIDPVNSRIFAMDPGPGKTVGIDLDQNTGNMTVAWTENQKTLSWFILIGPADQRVLVGTNISTNEPDPAALDVGPIGANYKEQIQWREASTGKLLAASDFFSPMIVGMQVWAGYGGFIYEGLNDGHIMALKVLPQTNIDSNLTSNNTTTRTTTTQNSSGAIS